GEQATLLARVTYAVVILLGFIAQLALNRLALGPSGTVGGALARGFARVASIVAVLFLFSIALMIVAVMLLFLLGALGLIVIPAAGQQPPPSLILMLIVLVALGFAVVQL